MKKLYKILFIVLTPLALLSLFFTIYIYNYFSNIKEEIFNIADIDYSSLDMDEDFYHYYSPGYETIIGVDLSEHNIDVDFDILKQQGIEYAFIRLGWRGYYDPQLHLDKKFEEYYEDANKAGIKVGVYFFSQAISEEEAIEEANFVLENIKDKTIDMYVVYDCETIEDVLARTNELSKEQATKDAMAFLTTVSNAGYNAMLYANMDWIKNHYENTILDEYPIWFAQYSKTPQYKGKHIIWQYASGATIDGVYGNDGVDLNLMIIKKDFN